MNLLWQISSPSKLTFHRSFSYQIWLMWMFVNQTANISVCALVYSFLYLTYYCVLESLPAVPSATWLTSVMDLFSHLYRSSVLWGIWFCIKHIHICIHTRAPTSWCSFMSQKVKRIPRFIFGLEGGEACAGLCFHSIFKGQHQWMFGFWTGELYSYCRKSHGTTGVELSKCSSWNIRQFLDAQRSGHSVSCR